MDKTLTIFNRIWAFKHIAFMMAYMIYEIFTAGEAGGWLIFIFGIVVFLFFPVFLGYVITAIGYVAADIAGNISLAFKFYIVNVIIGVLFGAFYMFMAAFDRFKVISALVIIGVLACIGSDIYLAIRQNKKRKDVIN